jgi:hypothetical protein
MNLHVLQLIAAACPFSHSLIGHLDTDVDPSACGWAMWCSLQVHRGAPVRTHTRNPRARTRASHAWPRSSSSHSSPLKNSAPQPAAPACVSSVSAACSERRARRRHPGTQYSLRWAACGTLPKRAAARGIRGNCGSGHLSGDFRSSWPAPCSRAAAAARGRIRRRARERARVPLHTCAGNLKGPESSSSRDLMVTVY